MCSIDILKNLASWTFEEFKDRVLRNIIQLIIPILLILSQFEKGNGAVMDKLTIYNVAKIYGKF